ncbi:MAG: glucohydrolase, partial [Lachnospiraceae bacterium]|nr:glucohydrolase [Lachnospiraceae bacterium]
PVNENYVRVNAERDLKDGSSLFHHYQKLIALRKNPAYKDTFVYGKLTPYLEEEENLMAYIREGENQQICVLANFDRKQRKVFLPSDAKQVLLNNLEDYCLFKKQVILDGYQALVIELA